MRRLSSRLSTPQEPTINITPLIDVVFSLLIGFIVMAPLLELDRIQLAPSEQAASHLPVHVDNANALSIHVDALNHVAVNRRSTTLAELPQLLTHLRTAQPTLRPQLFHDKQAAFGTYQAIKNALEAAGFDELDVVLAP